MQITMMNVCGHRVRVREHSTSTGRITLTFGMRCDRDSMAESLRAEGKDVFTNDVDAGWDIDYTLSYVKEV